MKTMTLWLCNVCLIYAYQEISRVVIKLWVNWSNILKNLYKIYRMPFHIPLFQFIFKLLILNAQSEAKAFLVSSYKLWKSVVTHVNSLILANEKLFQYFFCNEAEYFPKLLWTLMKLGTLRRLRTTRFIKYGNVIKRYFKMYFCSNMNRLNAHQ